MIWILLGLFALMWLSRWSFAFMCIVSVVISFLLLVFAFIAGSLVLFLYRPDALRGWTLPHLWWDDLVAQDSLLTLFAGLPFVWVADIVRTIMHILLHHPHPLLWAFMIMAGVPVVRLWWSAVAAIAARNSRD